MQGVFDFLGMSAIINYLDILYWEDVKDLLELLLKFTLIIPFQALGVNITYVKDDPELSKEDKVVVRNGLIYV